MIRMSRVALLFAAGLALGAGGCDHSCGLIGCNDGLTLSFEGLAAGVTYEVAIYEVTGRPETVPLAKCITVAAGDGSPQLYCQSDQPHSEGGNSIYFSGSRLAKVLITISSNGNTLVNQTADISYQSSELNGPGCGVCTSATLTVTVPAT